jgi:hypothetical protein
MSLDTLPGLVLVTILDKLDMDSHLALSYTCKSLHYLAIEALYGHTEDVGESFESVELLEDSLRLNPANAQFIRVWNVNSGAFQISENVLSEIVFCLQKLIFLDGWSVFESADGYEWPIWDLDPPTLENKFSVLIDSWIEFVSSCHSETSTRAAVFNGTMGELEILSGCAFSHAFASRGLVHLEFDLSCAELGTIRLPVLFDKLRGHPLEHVSVRLNEEDFRHWNLVRVDDLPNLRSLAFYLPYNNGNETDMEYGFPKLMDLRTWEFLRGLMARGIFLWIDAVFPLDVVVSFYRVVHRFASAEDHKPAIEWLVRGDQYYHTQIHGLRQYDIDIRDLSQLRRNCTLHLPDLPHPLRLRISVGKADSVERSNGR